MTEKDQIEAQLVHAKMQWATLELDRDNLILKLTYQGDKIADLTQEKDQLEQLLVKNKQELGEALNQAYEFEKINTALIEKLEEEGKRNERQTESAGFKQDIIAAA